MWKCEKNFNKVTELVNDFFRDHPTETFPGFVMAFKKPDDEDQEPNQAILSPIPPGDRQDINPIVNAAISAARRHETVAYVIVVREAWGLFVKPEERVQVTCAVSEHKDRKSIMMIEVFEKDTERMSVSIIDESNGRKTVPAFEPLVAPSVAWRAGDTNVPPDATRH